MSFLQKIRLFLLIVLYISFNFAVDVTFSVDMSNENLIPECSPTIAGTFNDWNYTYSLNDQGNGIWQTVLDLSPNNYYEFKFGICGWELESLSPGGDCTSTFDQWTNRFLNVDNQNQILDTYYYGTCNISLDGGENNEGWQLVWSDEFEESNIDMSKWSYDVGTGNWGWGNGEAQYYTNNSNNSFIEDGKLIIRAMLQNYGGANYTSARMVTKNQGDWTYGKFIVRAKIPAGVGTWPAIWMLPTDEMYGGWPYSGEIDIMEAVGFDHGTIHANAHCETYNWWNGIPPIGGDLFVNDFDTEFHDYIIEWDENNIKWYVDDTQYYIYTNNNQGSATWPFDQDFHLLLNIAIGGTWGGQEGIDDSIFPVQMEVDYVRVYQHSDEPETKEVTFLVDMQNEEVDETGIYVSGSDLQLAGPSGILMSNLGVGNDIWSITVPMTAGTYNYKFRNGYYEYWDGPGWESSDLLQECGFGTWNDRQFTVNNEDLVLGPYCFGSCEPCINNNVCENLGDINEDGILNVVDIVNIINIILSDDIISTCSDYNQDGTTNIVDIVLIVSVILGN